LKELGSLKDLNRLDLSLTHISDNGLSYLAASRHLRELSLAGCKQITDAGLVHVRDLKNLETLKLGYTDLNGAGFVYLKSLKKLAYLDLSHTKVRSEGLQHLSGMTQLRSLHLQALPIRDKAIVSVQKLTGLEELNLAGCEHFSTKALLTLATLKNLKYLDLQGAKAGGEEAIEKLKSRIPGVEIVQ
jgi:Leucine-rich repeat (LRR) protein